VTALWTQLEWRHPAWLLLALAPLAVVLWRARRGGGSLQNLTRFADPHLWPWLLVGTPRARHLAVLAVAWLAAAAAAGGPEWRSPTQDQQARRGIDIMVVADISPSMLAADVQPSRLARLKLELRDFSQLLRGDRVGLIPFSANAYLTLPLTHDRDAFMYFVNALDPGLASKTGSDLPRALALAEDTLQAAHRRGRAVVLLTDGENHGPEVLSTARRLGREGIPLYILGMGTTDGGPVPTPQGQFLKYDGAVVVSHLRRDTLQHLAAVSGGAYTDLRGNDDDWTTLLDAMRRSVPENRYTITTAKPTIPLFPWCLAVSLTLFLWAGAARAGPALAILCLTVGGLAAPPPADAAPWREQAALRALQGGEYSRAAALYKEMDTYTGHLGAGAAAYRLQDYTTAAREFTRATALAGNDDQLAKAQYDLGNALARQHRFDAAGDAYRRALAARPNFPHAALNLTLINTARQQRLGNRAGDNAKLTLHDMEQSGRQIQRPVTAPTGNAATPGAAPSASPPGQRQARGEAPPRVQSRPTSALKQWDLRPGDADQDLTAALERLHSLDTRPNALMSYFYSDLDVKAGILPQEKPW
jgi:Ca-activated chloride channel family protein